MAKSIGIQADNRTIRTYPKAPRGEIFDRNGVPVVENRSGYSIQIFKTDITAEELNKKYKRYSKTASRKWR